MQISKKRELPRKCELKYCEGLGTVVRPQILAGFSRAGGRGCWNDTDRYKQRKLGARVRVCAHARACVRWGRGRFQRGAGLSAAREPRRGRKCTRTFCPNVD